MGNEIITGLRKKASRRATIVVLCAFAAMVLYMKAGHLGLSVTVAERVPLWSKWAILVVFLASIWYSDHAIQQRVLKPSLPPPPLALFIWDAVSGLAFAVATANARALFYVATYAWVLFLFASTAYYRWKGVAQQRRSESSRSGQ
jgi:hypothetical protein